MCCCVAAAAPIYVPALLTSFIVPVTFGIVGVVGIFGNALVILVVVTNAQMRSTTNVLILNLAFADLLFIVFCVPFTATDYAMNGTWPFGPPVGMLALPSRPVPDLRHLFGLHLHPHTHVCRQVPRCRVSGKKRFFILITFINFQ